MDAHEAGDPLIRTVELLEGRTVPRYRSAAVVKLS